MPHTNKINVVLIFGPPGSGKGTISNLLSKVAPLLHVSTGQILRDMIKCGTMSSAMEGKPDLWPDEQVNNIVSHAMTKHASSEDSHNIILLDGYPRTTTQAQFLDSIADIKAVISLRADRVICKDRILGRAETGQRKDDVNIDTLYKRLDIYKENENDLLRFLCVKPIITLDASKPVLHVLGKALVGIYDLFG